MATMVARRGRGGGAGRRGDTLSEVVIVIFGMLTISSVALAIEDADANALDTRENDLPQYPPAPTLRQYGPPSYGGGGCPLCDSSVYSYCAQKVFYDSCCCDYSGGYAKPPQCYYSDCSLLYAKSCYEHSLIKNCCCNSPY